MPKQVVITPEVKAVLERTTLTDNEVRLPPGQLDRALYVEVDKVLKALGGRWNRGKRAHVFERGIEGQLAEALTAGRAVDQKRTAEQFFTPTGVAERVWNRADLRAEDHVLEPSAGEGALLVRPLLIGCAISAVELDERLAVGLHDMLAPHAGCVAWHIDFLDWNPPAARAPITRVVMNPPFSRGQDMAHVARALGLLAPGGILVAVMSPHHTFAADRGSQGFRAMLDDLRGRWEWEPLPANSFRASGTDVGTGILTIRKPS